MSTSSENPDSVAENPSESMDPLDIVIQIEPALEFTMRGQGVTTSYVAHDRRTGKYYQFGTTEYHAVSMLDGKRSLQGVCRQLSQDGVVWSPEEVVAFARQLTEHHLAKVVAKGIPSAPSKTPTANGAGKAQTQPGPAGRQQLVSGGLRAASSVISLRFPLFNGDNVAKFLLPILGPLFSPRAMLAWCVLVISGVSVAGANTSSLSDELGRIFDSQLWLVMAAIWCVLKCVHECGHAVCAKRHGVRVGKMGIMFFLMAPLAYVDVTDAWKLVRRRDRVQIAMAGVYLELAVGAIAAWVWWMLPIGFAKHLAAQVFFVAGPATLLVNANPLLRLDGYYVLSDALEIPNLRGQGRRMLSGWMNRLLFRLPLPNPQLDGWRNDFALLHAICSVVFQVVWMTGLVIAVSHWARGLGIIVACIAVFLWGLLPLGRWTYKIWTLQPSQGLRLNGLQRRLVSLGAATVILLQYAAVETSPFQRRVPIVVRYQNEQISRAATGAFVSAVYVKCGERVRKGDLLVQLDQPELLLKRDQWNDQRDVELAKVIQHQRRGEIAAAESARESADSLARRIEELDQQIQSMRITAERDGRVITPQTETLLGRYVKEGEVVIRIADPQEKELLAVIAETDLESYATAVETHDIATARLRGGVVVDTQLQPLRPAASRNLPHPALAATAGGPLAVEASDALESEAGTDSQRLVQPQLQTVLPLNAYSSLAVKSGQVGRLTIPDERTLIARIWDHVTEEQ